MTKNFHENELPAKITSQPPQISSDSIPATPPPTFSNLTPLDKPLEKPNQRKPARGARLFYFFPTVCLVCCVVWLGPMILENYQYALTRGKLRAEYENADQVLKQNQPLSNVTLAYQLVAQKIGPSVVSIRTSISRSNGGHRWLEGGQGSGVILSSDGYIMTNFHVIKDAVNQPANPKDKKKFEIVVSLPDHSQAPATVVGYDSTTDLAVLRVRRRNLLPAEWGDSENLNIGSMVWAVGSPYGFENTITAGIVSGKNRQGNDRENTPLQEFIQSDAAVNPGNSGGPLVDSQGRVVGINTHIFGKQFQGISFAIPSADAKFVYEQILEKGKVDRGYLGAELLDCDFINRSFLEADEKQRLRQACRRGVYVRRVPVGEPAQRSGIKSGDVIRSWNGMPVTRVQNLFRKIAMTTPGEKVEIEIIRGDQPKKLNVQVGQRQQFIPSRQPR
jgi:S1-C subfamily serine protease